jgi:hypothetical protein
VKEDGFGSDQNKGLVNNAREAATAANDGI